MEWVLFEPLIPSAKPGGRPRTVCMLEVVNAIFYVLGCAWRLLPHDFPPWQTVYGYFRSWRKTGVWEQINDALLFCSPLAGGTADGSARSTPLLRGVGGLDCFDSHRVKIIPPAP